MEYDFVFDNAAKQFKYRVLVQVAKYAYEGTLEEHVAAIPYDIIPGPLSTSRCCAYKEREIIRERLISAQGLNLPGQGDDHIVGVLPAACEGCPISRFRVTDNCQHCLAQKCKKACHFGAISITPKGAYIDPQKCRECGRCAAVCPYNAISDTLRPCVRACPVKAIGEDEFHRSRIDYTRCISCGACVKNCPFGAITDRSRIVEIVKQIKSGTPVIACFAPAIEGQFGTATTGAIKQALKQLGFYEAVEVSLGADATASHEAGELVEAMKNGKKMTTSCCPAFVEMIEKHFPKLKGNISDTASPMAATVRYIRMKKPGAKVVFIGPCIAKKLEIKRNGDTADYVMTFEELVAMFEAKNISLDVTGDSVQDGSRAGKGFAQSGGVAGSVLQVLKEEGINMPVSYIKCSGAAECKKALALMNAGRLQEDFVEGMVCEGGCIAGPAGIESVLKVKRNRTKLLAAADKRGVKENVTAIHDFSHINMQRQRKETL